MQTGFNKNSLPLQNQALPPAEIPTQAPLQPLQASKGSVENEDRIRPVIIIDEPSPSTITVQKVSEHKFQELQTTLPSTPTLANRAKPKLSLTLDGWFKHVKAAAKLMEKEVEAVRRDQQAWKEGQKEKKELQKQKCKFFWQQAEELFHDSFNKIREERKHKAITKTAESIPAKFEENETP